MSVSDQKQAEVVEKIQALTADNLKSLLWDTANDLRAGRIQPRQADGIAGLAREITRIVKTQLQVATQNKQAVPQAVLDYTGR